MSTQPRPFISPERYLEIERAAEYKSEYFQGEIFAMPAARETHVLAASNLTHELHNGLKGKSCRIYTSDMRVHVNATGLYAYPDLSAVCGTPEFQDSHFDTLLNPVLIVEILSPSTESYDRGRKFWNYRSIPSLKEYLLVSTDRMGAELFTKQADGRWLLAAYQNPADVVELQSVGCGIPLGNVYSLVDPADLQSS
jgi:Uma2 family endonuclease